MLSSLDAPPSRAALAEAARVLEPGGWVWVETRHPARLGDAAEAAGLVVADEPADDDGRHARHLPPAGERSLTESGPV